MAAFWDDWLTVVVVGCLAVISPGANLAIVLRNSLADSRRAGVYTAAGLAAGNLVHATYSLIGIGVLVSRSVLLFNPIKWPGAAYLISIGIRSLRAPKPAGETIPARPARARGRAAAIHTGFLTNLLNPKVTLFFLALFTQIIRPDTPPPARALYGLTMVALEFGWFAGVAVLLSRRAIREHFVPVAHRVERATGAVLIARGLRVALARDGR